MRCMHRFCSEDFERARGFVSFFFSFLSNCRPLPELLRGLTHLITNAGSGLWHGARTAHH